MLAGCRWKGVAPKPELPPGTLGGPDHQHGHLLRSGSLPEPSRERRVGIAIVGAGIGGLACAWRLQRNGVSNFEVFELEKEVGGNSRAGENRVSKHPLGAHYLPVPPPSLRPLRELLAELGVLTGDPYAERPTYDEAYLCAAPQERLFAGGKWHEGLLPESWIPPSEREPIARFLRRMECFKQARGVDGKLAFTFPVRDSSQDPIWTDFDKMSFKEWMEREGFQSPELAAHLNYACRDDFGTDFGLVSAWAGIHYFAARRGKAANGDDDHYLTRPEGNLWLANGLAHPVRDRISTQRLAVRMETQNGAPFVDFLHVATGEVERIHADLVVWASPLFLLPFVWRDMPAPAITASKQFTHAPWVVANLELSRRPLDRPGAEMAWDNVIRESGSLGYVVATHQIPRVLEGPTTLTWYQPLTLDDPASERTRLLGRTRESVAEEVLADLEQVHPDIRACCTRLDVWRWGHAMVRPTVGFLWHSDRRWFEQQTGQVLFAHSDLSGMSLFEEAFLHGVRAADQIGTQKSTIDSPGTQGVG